jgi:hypothetical protein
MSAAQAQVPVQTIRGKVTDKSSGMPLQGVLVAVITTNPTLGAATDEEGNFRIGNVPVGRHSIVARYTGYKEEVRVELAVSSGKELILDIQMEEDISSLQQVEIVEERDKREAINQMTSVSSRTFSVEETQKFAAAVNDPGRMALSFAGVVSGNDGSNQISIRGNSPYGLLWRMEGVDIPNPNHFASAAAAGGGISILSAQTLADSDFMTGAFAAEYGNALGGVFDLRLRKGNNERREYTFQAGVLGIDAAAEGPVGRPGGGSYLINYRYSTLSLLGRIGVPIGDAETNFQDLSYNIVLPTSHAGTFQVFGFGGLSTQRIRAKRDSTQWELPWHRIDDRFHSHTGAMGFRHTIRTGENGFLTSSAVLSGNTYGYKADWITDDLTPRRDYEESFNTSKITLSVVQQQKLGARQTLRAGLYLNEHRFSLEQLEREEDSDPLLPVLQADGRAHTVQPFVQLRYRLTDKLTLNTGLHVLMLTLNQEVSVEPRAGMRYQLHPRHTVSLAYGLHSQMQPVGIYNARAVSSDEEQYPNRSLGFNKAHHFVTGYEWSLTRYLYLKAEFYYQELFNVAVGADPNSTLSSLNNVENYIVEKMTSTGRGRNYGVELTVEQFTWKGMYFLLSASLYESKYHAGDGVWRNTRFNANHAMTFTAGKEWKLRKSSVDRTFGANVRMIWTGGMRETPVDLERSREEGWTVRDDSRAFEIQNPDYLRADVRFSVRTNKFRSTRTLALDLQNATNRKNLFGSYFDPNSGAVETAYQLPLLPVLSYKVEF